MAYTANMIGSGDSYRYLQQGVISPDQTRRFHTFSAWGILTTTPQLSIPLWLAQSTPKVADIYPKIRASVLSTLSIVGASLRVPSLRNSNLGNPFQWGSNISDGASILCNANDKLALVFDSAIATQINSGVSIAGVSGVITPGSSVRAASVAGTPLLGVAPTVDGLLSLEMTNNAGTAFATTGIRVSSGESALIIVDVTVSSSNPAVKYEDIPNIGRKDIFLS